MSLDAFYLAFFYRMHPTRRIKKFSTQVYYYYVVHWLTDHKHITILIDVISMFMTGNEHVMQNQA